MSDKNKKTLLEYILSPRVILSCIGLGVLIGYAFPKVGHTIPFMGKIYLDLLRMCVLPIVIAAIVSSIGRLLTSGYTAGILRRLVLVFVVGLLISSSVSMLLGHIGQPGRRLSEDSAKVLGHLLVHEEGEGTIKQKVPDLSSFLKLLIPTNPFAAASEGRNLSLVFFSILLGLALGSCRTSASQTALVTVSGFFDAFIKMITWVLYALPIGLVCLFAGQVSKYGFSIFVALGHLIVLMMLGAIGLATLYVVLIHRFSGKSWRTVFSALKEPAFVALGTSSSFATIPVVLMSLRKKLDVNEDITNLVVPLGVTLNPQGTTFCFTMASLFMVQLYDVSLGFGGTLIILLGGIFTSFAITGVPGIAGIYMIGIILDPIGIPVETAVVLLLALLPVLDPIFTTINTLANCLATVYVDASERKRSLPEQESNIEQLVVNQ